MDKSRVQFLDRSLSHNVGQLSLEPPPPPESLNRVPALAGGKGGILISAGWHVTLCDPIWHITRSCEAKLLLTAIHCSLYFTLLLRLSNV